MSFNDRLTELLNSQAVATAIGVAHRCGLLTALGQEPEELDTIATRAGVQPRYAQEILAVLTTGNVVELQTDCKVLRYFLPADRAKALHSMGLYFEELPLLVQCAFGEVCSSARTGKAVTSNYAEFGVWMGRGSDSKHERTLTQKFLPALDGGAVVEQLQSGGARVCDLGCGRGAAAILIAKAFPEATVVGIDFDEASVEAGRREAAEAGLKNLEFVQGDVSNLPASLSHSFDLVTAFDVIHDMSRPAAGLCEARKLLNEGGRFAMVDIRAHSCLRDNLSHPLAPFLYAVSLLHCMPQGLKNDGLGLGMMWGRERALAMLDEAGFSTQILELDFDNFNDCYLCQVKDPS